MFKHIATQYPTTTNDAQESSKVPDDLEARIDTQVSLLREDRSPDENRATWLELTRLHSLRSPRRIAEMEREVGLAR